jgi:hypothetical protein
VSLDVLGYDRIGWNSWCWLVLGSSRLGYVELCWVGLGKVGLF